MRDYLVVAQRFGADVQVLQARGNYENVHDVPKDVVQMQKERFIPYEEFMYALDLA